MLIAARNAMMAGKRLPYDAEVEWLKGDGASWIDTNYIPNAQTKSIYCDFDPSEYPNSDGAIYGFEQGPLRLTIRPYNDVITYYTGNPGRKITDISTLSRCSITCNFTEMTLSNGSSTYSLYGNFSNNTFHLLIMAQSYQSATNAVQVAKFKFHSMNIVDIGNHLVRDIIPVRVGTTGAIYDKRGVGGMNPDGSARNDGMYFNRGTGAFVIGPDI